MPEPIKPQVPSHDTDVADFWRARSVVPLSPGKLPAGRHRIRVQLSRPSYVELALHPADKAQAPLFMPLDPVGASTYAKTFVTRFPALHAEVRI
jgi:hypothetical protein